MQSIFFSFFLHTPATVEYIIYILRSNMRKQELTEGHKVLLFIGYTAGMYVCTIAAAIFEEKLYLITQR